MKKLFMMLLLGLLVVSLAACGSSQEGAQDPGTEETVQQEGSTVAGQCIFRNQTKEVTLDWSFPKFLVDTKVEAVCEDCIGAVLPMGDLGLVFDGQTYTMADAALFVDLSDPEAGFVPYTGQQASCFCVVQWWEDGTKNVMVECGYDPNR